MAPILVGATVLLGWVGFYEYLGLTGGPQGRAGVWEALFLAAGLPLQETATIDGDWDSVGLSLHIARGLSLLVIPYAFVLAFLALFGNLLRPLRIRSWRWFRPTGPRHTAVCGLGWKGYELVGDLTEKKSRVVAIELNEANPFIPATRALGAVVIEGDGVHIPTLRDADISEAEKIFVVCDSDETNIRILKQIASLVAMQENLLRPIGCSVEILDRRTREFVHRMFPEGRGLQLHSFDTYETTARQLLDVYPIDRFPLGSSRTEARIIIVGYSPMARAILEQVILIGHFPAQRKVHVSVVTDHPDRDQADFLRNYPCFHPDVFGADSAVLRRQVLPEVEFTELPGSDTVLLAEQQTILRAVAHHAATSIYICLDDGLRSAAYASALLPSLASAAASNQADVQLFYYYEYPEDEDGFLVEKNLRELGQGLPVHTFDGFLTGCSADRVEGRPADDMARQIAQFYQREYGGRDWWGLSEADRMSNRRAADHLGVKLRSIGAELVDSANADSDFSFTEAEVAMLAEMEHHRWSAEKLLEGWRPLPRTADNQERWQKDKQALKLHKLHFDLVPFDDLDEHGRGKDRSQIQSIPQFTKSLGKGICRQEIGI